MFDDLSGSSMFFLLCALALGFGITRFFLVESEAKTAAPNTAETAPDEPAGHNTSGQWFEVLEVSSSSSMEEIKAAYKKKISLYHPDKVSSLGAEFQVIAERKSKQINAAYEFISRRYGGS